MALTTVPSLNDIVTVTEVDGATGKTNNSLGQIVAINPDGLTYQVRGVSGHAAHFIHTRSTYELTATTFHYSELGIQAKSVADPVNGVV